MNYINAIFEYGSMVLAAMVLLVFATTVVVEVVKNLFKRVPTNIVAVVVSLIVTILAVIILCTVLNIPIVWYYIVGAVLLGVFVAYVGAVALGFTGEQAASIGIIGGADGPTAIFLTSKLAPELLGPIAIAAYSYMALIPMIQPPLMKLLTTRKERAIVMKNLRPVSKLEKVIFPLMITVVVCLIIPSAVPLVGCLMFGNLLNVSGVTERLSKTAQNELINIVTIFLGVSVGATANASTFLSLETLSIIALGLVAFLISTCGGLLTAKLLNLQELTLT